MRSTGFALLGITAAMGLGLVAFVSQQGWPYLPAAPIPGNTSKHGTLDNAIALAPISAESNDAASHVTAHRSFAGRASAPAEPNDSRVYGSHQVAFQPAAPQPVAAQPGGESAPASTPAGQTVDPVESDASAPAPVAVTTPTPESAGSADPASSPAPPASASAKPGKGHAYGTQKAVSAAKEKPSHAPPHSSPSPAAPSPPPSLAEPGPPAAEAAPTAPSSDGPGNGRGHAYGHDK